ncbi:MAG: hypothetical protein HCAMLNBO_01255 [Candidatus Brocadia fulgida]|jgi:hypothetical protein|nr:hypothetical protein [Candidatus Brocadia fulgida]
MYSDRDKIMYIRLSKIPFFSEKTTRNYPFFSNKALFLKKLKIHGFYLAKVHTG